MNTRRVARVLLASLGWLAFSFGAALAVTLPFNEGFENVPVGYYPKTNGWRTWMSGVTAYVSSWGAHSGSRSFRLQSYPSWSRCDYIYLDQIPNRLTYQVSVYTDPIPGRAACVGLANGDGYEPLFCNYFTIRSQSGAVGTADFTGAIGFPPVLLGTFPLGQWVTVGAELDFAARAASLWLDGVLIATDVPVQPKEFDLPTPGHVVLNRFAAAECNWRGGGTGVIYLDDVAVFEPALPIIEAVIDMAPDTLKLRANGRWVTCYIELPEGYSVTDIDLVSLLLNDLVGAEPWPASVADYDCDGTPDLMVKFSRPLLASILRPGLQEIALTGQLVDGTLLAGSDVIRVIP